ncbi:MAG: ferrous iron transport protein B [Gammaproteobacteria bacterium]|jgi:ferrous iron transport protein B|nr:ferrous iron transport protein B [Gammaproteobacteria bacterium]MBT3488316.1 ferrous iron transport protein B [Gammaproteobacteria bacterium]MBT3718416.1 ferrous iron transport protein B [Gammaproteobacteria bacterium]MBT3844855.1 ferrous iron transport protein B [Gammaproteobacteria bacterium]MBT3894359.1 ferrous iron transport protein B [Gammaproteobacteria bacterium]
MNTPPPIRAALIGNPNTGRTTLFNKITGEKQATGNYARVTISKNSHIIEHQGVQIELIDLPGVYMLNSKTDEEKITRDLLRKEQPDIVINVINAGNMERNLMLTTQLIEMGLPRIFVLNMKDEAERQGVQIDNQALSSLLGGPIVETVGRDGTGLDQLLDEIVRYSSDGQKPCSTVKIGYDSHLEESINQTTQYLNDLHPDSMSPEQCRWTAIKLLEGDTEIMEDEHDHAQLIEHVQQVRSTLHQQHDESAESLVLSGRYGFINGLLEEVRHLEIDTLMNRVNVTRAIDGLLLNRLLGLPLFLALMWVMFETTFTLGAYPMDWIDAGVGALSDGLSGILPDSMFKDLLINGIIAGMGGTIIFLPNIVILFFFIALFSETGYMARGAVLVDRMMHNFGLHGKAFIPMITGFGCNVPAIMATRTIENPKDRLVAILVNPFMSCSARLPVFVLFSGAFFAESAGTVLFSVYMASIAIALLTALVLSKTIIKGANTAPFLMELPPYRAPTWGSIWIHMGRSGAEFIKKVTGVILVGSIIIWFLQTFPQEITMSQDYDGQISSLQSQPENDLRDQQITELERAQEIEVQQGRYLGQVGSVVQPLFAPLNFDLNASIALLTGFVAKEVVVATFGVLYSHGEEVTEENRGLRESLAASMTPMTAIAFMIFTLLYVPCLATIAVLYKETQSLKWTAFSIGLSLTLAYSLALLATSVGGTFI